jgi:hypothetical protein
MTARLPLRRDRVCHCKAASRGNLFQRRGNWLAVLAVALLLAGGPLRAVAAEAAAAKDVKDAAAKTQPDTAKPAAAKRRPKVKKLFDGKTLKGWKVTDFGAQGPVRVEEGKLILGAGELLTGVTWKGPFPKTNFEVALEAMRVDGSDFFCGLTVPVGKGSCSLILGGWGGTLTGISCIDNSDASENETTDFIRFEAGRWYKVRMRVTDKKIEAWIDAKKIVDVNREGKEFEVRIEVELSRPFGIAAYQTTAALRKITLRPVIDQTLKRKPKKQ